MKKATLLLTLLCSVLLSYGQNMVINGDFETYTACPTGYSQTPNATGWRSYTSGGSSDFLHACATAANVDVPSNYFGYQYAASGDAYTGGYSYTNPTGAQYVEYVAGTLTPLQIGKYYEVSLSVSLANNSASGHDGLAIYFFDNGPTTITGSTVVTNVTPQISFNSYGPITDTTNWVRLTKVFQADSAYDNLVIGCFTPVNNLTKVNIGGGNYNYYYYDSIVVRPYNLISFSYPDTVVCAGDSLHIPFTVTQRLNPANVFTLQLSNASGSFATPTTIGTLASDTSGTIHGRFPATFAGTGYRIRIVSSSPALESDNNGANIRVKPKPTPVALVNSPICEGTQLNFIANALPNSTYSWTGPASYTATLQNPVITGTTVAHTGDYIVTATLEGCSAKDTVTATVRTQPAVPTATVNTPICETQTLYLNANTTTPGVTYSWAGPGGYTATIKNPVINNAMAANTGAYTITVGLNGCNATATVNAVVNLTPAAPVATNSSPVCVGGALSLTALSSTPGVTYSWTGSGNYTSTLQNPVIDPVGMIHANPFSVTASLNGCTSAAGTTTPVINNVTYLGAYASPNDTVCEGNPITVVTVPVNGGSNPSFQWYKNNQEITGATNLTFPILTPVTGDSFYCRMIASGVCNTTLTLYSNKIGITVLPRDPSPTVVVTSVPANPMPGNAVTFTATVTNGGTNPTYQWKRNRQDIVGAKLNTWSASNLNPYDTISVAVTSSNPCPEDTIVNSNLVGVNFATAIGTYNNNEALSLYPNPNNGAFTLKGNTGAATVDAEVWNSVGQLVYQATFETKHGLLNENIALDKTLEAGVYMLKLKTTANNETIRFTISK